MYSVSSAEDKKSGAGGNRLINFEKASFSAALTLLGFTLYGAIRFGQLSFYSYVGIPLKM
jgi:hypothetical protein